MSGNYTKDWYLKQVTNIDQPTTSTDTILAANALNYHTWRTENDKLLQRMGELRHNGEEAQGAWFRLRGTKIGRDGKFDFENKYTSYELGYDTITKNTDDKIRYQGRR
ncbi:MAG: autotransporter outer membrane beta-barrel domain-containing protein [Phascolarctobacterium faecium]